MTSSEGDNRGSFAFTTAVAVEGGWTAVKTITRRGDGALDKSDYPMVSRWIFKPEQARGLDAMALKLRRLARQQDRMIIMGAPRPEVDLERAQRRWWAKPDPRVNTLQPVGRAWLPIDCDGAKVPPGMGRPERLAEAAAFIRDTLLPEEFRGISCIVTPTASTGLVGPDVARLRLFFQLDRYVALEDLRRWARGAQCADLPVDAAVTLAGQPIYTGRPIFDGMADPVPRELHAVVVGGVLDDRVSLVLDRFDERLVTVERRVAELRHGGGDWRAVAQQEVGGDMGFYVPLTLVLGMAARTSEEASDVADFLLALLAGRADKARIAQYDSAWIMRSIRRFRRQDDAARARLRDAIQTFRIEDLDND